MTTVTILAGDTQLGTATVVRRDLGVTAHQTAPSITVADVSPSTLLFQLAGRQYNLFVGNEDRVFVGCQAGTSAGGAVTFLAMDVFNKAGESILG
jgi:hypothetical protein